MNRISYLLLAVVLLASLALAGDIELDMVRNAAENHLIAHRFFCYDASRQFGDENEQKYSVGEISILEDNSGGTLAYIAQLEPRGYIALSANTGIRPVIAYSYVCDFVFEEFLENILLSMLKEDMRLRLLALPQINPDIIERNSILWNRYVSGDKALLRELATTETYGPWIQTDWHQDSPYNDRCPIDPETSTRCVVGCVALAFGQILEYWEWPPSVHFGSGASYFSESTTPSIFIDATTASIDTIDYRGAGDIPTNEACADLLFACGVSVRMSYSSEGSGSDTPEVTVALLDRFDYASAENRSFMDSDLYTTLQENMLNMMPAELGVGGWGVGGHAIVGDGYKTSGEFHLNMGWGGYQNGWYFLPDEIPEGLTMFGHEVINILPPVITCRPPSYLNAYLNLGSYIRLDWQAPFMVTDSVLSYDIYRSDGYSGFELIGTTNSTDYIDSTTEELTLYTYGIRALYESCESGNAEVSILTGIQDGWSRDFGEIGIQSPKSVVSTSDSGCIAVGYTDLSGGTDMDAFVVRATASGNEIWSMTYGDSQNDRANSVIKTIDGDYVVAGMTESVSDMDGWLFKIDEDGEMLWSKTFGGSDDEEAMDIALCPDGGFIIAGNTSSGTENSIFLVRANSSGDTTWAIIYGSAHYANSVTCVSDGGFLAAGYMSDGPLGQDDMFLLKTDADGETLWTQTYGGASADMAYSVIEYEGGFAIAGGTKSYGIPTLNRIYVLNIAENGDTIWTRNYGAMTNYYAYSICQAEDSNLLITGSCVTAGNTDIYLIKMESDGDTVETITYGTDGTDVAYSAQQGEDGGILIAASTTYFSGEEDYWLLKLGGYLPSGIHDNQDSPKTKPEQPKILNAYPNPFNSTVSITYEIDTDAHTAIEIYNISGHCIAAILNGYQNAGVHHISWKASQDIPSGVYFIRLSIGNRSATQRIVLVR